MNILLWGLQIILAIKLLTVMLNHGLRPDPVKMQRGREWLGAVTRPLLAVIAVVALLVAAMLVLPATQSLLPFVASFAGLMMLIATGFHLRCREEPKVWVSLILFALAAFLVYGRSYLHPL